MLTEGPRRALGPEAFGPEASGRGGFARGVSLPGPQAFGRPSPTSPHPGGCAATPSPLPPERERGGDWGRGEGQADTPRAEPSGRGPTRSAQGGRFQSAE